MVRDADRMSLSAATISVGDELAYGQNLDTHGRWLADRLIDLGVRVREHRVLADERAHIADAIRDLAARVDLLLVTGGLGPTPDDLTREGLADAVNAPLISDPDGERVITTMFRRRKRTPSASNLRQARRPEGATLLANPNGTAPGVRMDVGGCTVFLLPGPPAEMYPMFDADVVPVVRARGGAATGVVRLDVHAYGLPESDAADMLGDLLDRGREPAVGVTASGAVISARIRAHDGEARNAAEATAREVQRKWTPHAFGRDGDTVAIALGRLLEERGLTIATCESCTGGGVGAMLTETPGSSVYYVGGFVTYSNDMKTALADVPATMLDEHGAVSEPVVRAMAAGAARRTGADLAVSISGVAGPDGGSADKPVGTVWIGGARRSGGDEVHTWARRFRFPGGRAAVRDRSAKASLQMARFDLLDPDARPPLLWEVV